MDGGSQTVSVPVLPGPNCVYKLYSHLHVSIFFWVGLGYSGLVDYRFGVSFQ